MKTSEMPVEMFPSKCWEKPLKLGAERDSLKFERERESLKERGREKESGRKKVISHLRARKKMKTVISRSSFLDLILKLSKACSWLLLVWLFIERERKRSRERELEKDRERAREFEKGAEVEPIARKVVWAKTNHSKTFKLRKRTDLIQQQQKLFLKKFFKTL